MNKKRNKSQGTGWTQVLIAEEKAHVKQAIAQLAVDDRMPHALRLAQAGSETLDPQVQLRAFIGVVSALVIEQNQPQLAPGQIRKLVQLAQSFLRVHGVEPGKGRSSSLYTDLHQALSLVYRRSGLHWRAAWEQQLAQHYAPREGDESGFASLALASRAIRLGNAALAWRRFETALASGSLSADQSMFAAIGKVRCLRLAGQADAAAAALTQLNPVGSAAQREIAWEAMCLRLRRESDLAEILAATKDTSASHYTASYLLETFLWTRAVQSKRFLDSTVKLRTIKRKSELHVRQQGFFFEACSTVEQCEDTTYPLTHRLGVLGETLARVDELITVDKELLVLAAAARWLARSHQFDLARFTLSRYRLLSWQLSDGQNADALGIAADMLASDWFAGEAWTSALHSLTPIAPAS
jgi:hypothetical protein